MGKRRGHGEGAIYQRESDGKWCASVDLGLVGGKRKRKVVYGETRKEVAEKIKALLRDQQQGVNIAPEVLTVEQFLKRWLDEAVKPKNKSSTLDSYTRIVNLYLVPHIGSLRLEKLTAVHVQTMQNTLLSEGLSTRTVQYARAVLRRALGQAVKWDLVNRNVVPLVDAPRVEKHRITPLDETQARRLLAAATGHRLEAMYRVALSLGLRKGEVLGLRWSNIDWRGRKLSITATVQRIAGQKTLTTPKTATSARTLLLPDVLIKVLRQHQERQELEREALGEEWQEHGLLFPSERGTPIEPRNIVRSFKRLLKRAGLPESTRFHDLRHSCATLLIAQGVHLSVIKEILGHSQISVTADIYGHVLPETQRSAVEQLGNILDAPEAEVQASAAEEGEAPDEDERPGVDGGREEEEGER
jgi:integrase